MPFATIPENVLRRYLGAKALAEKGATEGERNAARAIVQTLESKHPTIRIESELYDQMQRGEGPTIDDPPPPPRPPPGAAVDPNFGPYTASSGNWGGAEKKPQPQQGQAGRWGSVMDLLGQAWDVAKEVTEGAVNAEAGRLYADQSVTIENNQTAAGNMRYTAIAPIQMLMAAKYRFNDLQKQAFAKRVGERVAERVYAFLVAP